MTKIKMERVLETLVELLTFVAKTYLLLAKGGVQASKAGEKRFEAADYV